MQTTKKKVLIVDDEESFTRLLKMNLEQDAGYEVRSVNRARMAHEAALAFQPDIILLDVMMPDGDGGVLAAELEKDKRLRGVPVSFLTAAVRRTELGAAAGMIGGRCFVAKPARLHDLVEHIEKRTAAVR